MHCANWQLLHNAASRVRTPSEGRQGVTALPPRMEVARIHVDVSVRLEIHQIHRDCFIFNVSQILFSISTLPTDRPTFMIHLLYGHTKVTSTAVSKHLLPQM